MRGAPFAAVAVAAAVLGTTASAPSELVARAGHPLATHDMPTAQDVPDSLTGWSRPLVLVMVHFEDANGSKRALEIARHLFSTMQRWYHIVVDVPPVHTPLAEAVWKQYVQKLQYVHAALAVGPRDGALEAFAERVRPELGGRPLRFIAADLSDAAPLCCDEPVLRASILLQSARNYAEGDLHILNRHTHHVQGMRGESWFDSDMRVTCTHGCPQLCSTACDSSAPDWIASPQSLLGRPLIQRELPPPPLPAAHPETGPTDSEVVRASCDNFGQNRKHQGSNAEVEAQNRATEWAVMKSVTCCDEAGYLLLHASDHASGATLEPPTGLGLPSSTYRAAGIMPMRVVHTPYNTSSCTRVRGWAFYTMHGVCPSSQVLLTTCLAVRLIVPIYVGKVCGCNSSTAGTTRTRCSTRLHQCSERFRSSTTLARHACPLLSTTLCCSSSRNCSASPPSHMSFFHS